MSFVSLSCLGVAEVNRKLGRIPPAVQGVAVPDGLTASALLVERRAKQIVVEKDIFDTGDLLGSITAEPPSGSAVVVVSGAEYSIYNEFGTYRMAARPYMRPALDESAPEIGRIFGAKVRVALAKAVGG